MIPNVVTKGHSFNGAFAYYLHDKRQDGEARRDTAERVAWTETRNLATDDPDTARRIMIATASQAEALKKAAGIRSTGRKSTQHVYAYSIGWHDDEKGKIDRAEMVRAADASLKALGADHLQAVLVCHQDTDHPHVHIVLNRVNPQTGRMDPFDQNDFHKLDGWALSYRQSRAEEHKYCPARVEKRDARRAGLASTFERATPSPRRGQAPANFNDAAAPLGEYQALQLKAADLAKSGGAMRERHSAEWRELSAGGKKNWDGIFDQATADLANARSTIKELYRPHWRALFKEQAADRRAMRRAGLVGLVAGAWMLTRGERGEQIDGAFLLSVAQFVMSKEQRENRLADYHQKEQRKLGALVKRATDHEATKIRQTRAAALDLERGRFTRQRAALIKEQTEEKMKNRQAWRDINAARALLDLRRRDPTGRHFQTAGEIRAAAGVVDRQPRRSRGRSTGRTRSRTRTRDPGP